MKKVIVLTMALVAMAANAEVNFWDGSKADKSVVLAPRVGLNVSTMSIGPKLLATELKDFKESKVGFNVGLGVNVPIVKSFYINTGMFYTTKGMKFVEEDIDEKFTETYNAGFLEIPVYASYRLNFNDNNQLEVNFGPYFGIGVNGKVNGKYEDEDGTYKTSTPLFGESKEDDERGGMNRFNMGLGLGVGYNFHNIHLGLTYQFGLSNFAIEKEWGKNTSFKDRNFNISVGYNF